jgi:ribosomal protein S18 acetylase RimI-like enzyme
VTGGRALDPEALGDRVDRLYRAARGLCGSREEAADLVQETFARVLRKPTMQRSEDDLVYLLRVLRNTLVSMRRAAARQAVAGPLTLELIELSWQRRRMLYLERLRQGGFLVLARDPASVFGYALVCVRQGPDDTFPVGDRYAELYSLSVSSRLRGRGLGTQLLEFVDCELATRSIRDLKVAVMADNSDALRLYERHGFRPAEIVLYRFGSDA